MDDYDNMIGRLIYMYLRILDKEDGEDNDEDVLESYLSVSQKRKIQSLKDILQNGNELDDCFHEALIELFLWQESRKLLEVLDCPVQRFLVYASIERMAHGFISAREIGRIYAKLLYVIRSCIYLEFLRRSEEELEEDLVNEDLGGLMIYAKE
jgi:hypothetical protein